MNRIIILITALFIAINIHAQEDKKKNLNIVFIGNSITQGVIIRNPKSNAPPVKACAYLRNQPWIGEVKFSNQGVSGHTTVDFLPQTRTSFLKVKTAADTFKDDNNAQLIFSIMLGTNDSAIEGPHGAPISPEQYYANMRAIIDQLLSLYPSSKVIIHRPLWYSPNTHNNSRYLQEGLDRLQSYFPQLRLLLNYYHENKPGKVFRGDSDGFAFFQENYQTEFFPEEGNAGTFYLHPTVSGAAQLGEFWGRAIYRVVTAESN